MLSFSANILPILVGLSSAVSGQAAHPIKTQANDSGIADVRDLNLFASQQLASAQQLHPSIHWSIAHSQRQPPPPPPFLARAPIETAFMRDTPAQSLIEGDTIGQRFDNVTIPLRLLTFNVWMCGTMVNRGIEKIVSNIRNSLADIVALQEVNAACFREILTALGPGWSGVMSQRHGKHNVPALIAQVSTVRFNVSSFVDADATRSSVGVEVVVAPQAVATAIQRARWQRRQSGVRQENARDDASFATDKEIYAAMPKVRLWSLHLDYRDYGPYRACFFNKTHPPPFFTNRLREVIHLRHSDAFTRHLDDAREHHLPLIIMGDFNEPSHLDWTDSTKHLHCGSTHAWPVSKLLRLHGFADAYRFIHPDPSRERGLTWSTVQKQTDFNITAGVRGVEPQDRIDIVYVYDPPSVNKQLIRREERVRVRILRATPYDGDGSAVAHTMPLHRNNGWPSDHRGVLVDIELVVKQDTKGKRAGEQSRR